MKSFMVAFCFAVATDGLSVDAGAKTSLAAHDVSVKPAHAKHGSKNHQKAHVSKEHEAKLNLLMSQNPAATRELCDRCVAAEEDLVGNQTVLENALRNQTAATTALNDARALYDTCTDEETALFNTKDTLERALRTRLTTSSTLLASLKTMIDATLIEVNQPDADGAYASANPDRSYDGNGLLAEIDAWRTAFNNHATKVAECNTKHATVQGLESSLTSNNTAVTDAETAVTTANQTTVAACDAMRSGQICRGKCAFIMEWSTDFPHGTSGFSYTIGNSLNHVDTSNRLQVEMKQQFRISYEWKLPDNGQQNTGHINFINIGNRYPGYYSHGNGYGWCCSHEGGAVSTGSGDFNWRDDSLDGQTLHMVWERTRNPSNANQYKTCATVTNMGTGEVYSAVSTCGSWSSALPESTEYASLNRDHTRPEGTVRNVDIYYYD